jgi:hypothetical protein
MISDHRLDLLISQNYLIPRSQTIIGNCTKCIRTSKSHDLWSHPWFVSTHLDMYRDPSNQSQYILSNSTIVGDTCLMYDLRPLRCSEINSTRLSGNSQCNYGGGTRSMVNISTHIDMYRDKIRVWSEIVWLAFSWSCGTYIDYDSRPRYEIILWYQKIQPVVRDHVIGIPLLMWYIYRLWFEIEGRDADIGPI